MKVTPPLFGEEFAVQLQQTVQASTNYFYDYISNTRTYLCTLLASAQIHDFKLEENTWFTSTGACMYECNPIFILDETGRDSLIKTYVHKPTNLVNNDKNFIKVVDMILEGLLAGNKYRLVASSTEQFDAFILTLKNDPDILYSGDLYVFLAECVSIRSKQEKSIRELKDKSQVFLKETLERKGNRFIYSVRKFYPEIGTPLRS